MTHRLDSDVMFAYGHFKMNFLSSNEKELEMNKIKEAISKKTKLIAWFVRHCHTHSKRELYVQKLQQYIPVDIYGLCGNLSCPKKIAKYCDEMLAENYKFYIAFENSVCRDYITEKFFRMKNYIVPIVLCHNDYIRIAPPNSFVAADTFSSPEALAIYLKYLDSNPSEYMSYFEWRKFATVSGSLYNNLCNLCTKLHTTLDEHSAVLDVQNWWFDDARCKPGYAVQIAG